MWSKQNKGKQIISNFGNKAYFMSPVFNIESSVKFGIINIIHGE